MTTQITPMRRSKSDSFTISFPIGNDPRCPRDYFPYTKSQSRAVQTRDPLTRLLKATFSPDFDSRSSSLDDARYKNLTFRETLLIVLPALVDFRLCSFYSRHFEIFTSDHTLYPRLQFHREPARYAMDVLADVRKCLDPFDWVETADKIAEEMSKLEVSRTSWMASKPAPAGAEPRIMEIVKQASHELNIPVWQCLSAVASLGSWKRGRLHDSDTMARDRDDSGLGTIILQDLNEIPEMFETNAIRTQFMTAIETCKETYFSALTWKNQSGGPLVYKVSEAQRRDRQAKALKAAAAKEVVQVREISEARKSSGTEVRTVKKVRTHRFKRTCVAVIRALTPVVFRTEEFGYHSERPEKKVVLPARLIAKGESELQRYHREEAEWEQGGSNDEEGAPMSIARTRSGVMPTEEAQYGHIEWNEHVWMKKGPATTISRPVSPCTKQQPPSA